MKRIMIMLAVAMFPAAPGCNCCGLANCPCNPCNWFNRGAYCGPTATYAPVMAAPYAAPCAAGAPTVLPQYPLTTAGPAPYAAGPMAAPAMVGAPMIAGPGAQPLVYAEPGCGYVEPGCGYSGTVGYGPSMPMSYGGCESCEGGGYGGEMVGAPAESYVDPGPAGE